MKAPLNMDAMNRSRGMNMARGLMFDGSPRPLPIAARNGWDGFSRSEVVKLRTFLRDWIDEHESDHASPGAGHPLNEQATRSIYNLTRRMEALERERPDREGE